MAPTLVYPGSQPGVQMLRLCWYVLEGDVQPSTLQAISYKRSQACQANKAFVKIDAPLDTMGKSHETLFTPTYCKLSLMVYCVVLAALVSVIRLVFGARSALIFAPN